MTAAEAQPTVVTSRCQTALQAALESVESISPCRWLARHRDSSTPPLLAHDAHGFFVLSQEVALQPAPPRWALVKANAALRGLAKFCSLRGGELTLRAEIPLEAEGDLDLRVTQACAAFAAGRALALGHDQTSTNPTFVAPTPDLPNLVEAAGWQCSSQRGGYCTLPLETREGAHTALVTAQAGVVRACTELSSWDSLPEPSREAVAMLLLSANARCRLARAVVTEDKSGGVAELEVVFEAPVCAAELRAALEALSVGADLCAPAAESLRHEPAAQIFLALRGGPRSREECQHQTERIV
jgi:hypothetical protein